VGSRAHERQVAGVGGLGDLGQRGLEVGAGLGHGVADAGDDLDGAAEELGLGLGVQAFGEDRSDLGQDVGGAGLQRPRDTVDQAQLDLDPQRRRRRRPEVDLHGPSVREAAHATGCW